MVVSGAVEGAVDDALLRRLLADHGHEPGPVYVKNGKHGLLQKLAGYNAAAQFSPWLVLVDLNGDAPCAGPFVAQHLPAPAPRMLFRVAVRQAEAWLLADRIGVASFLRVPRVRLPADPETLPDAKQALVNVARHSSKRAVREEIIPRPKSGRKTGPAYVPQMIEFIQQHWSPQRAALGSDSLQRCLHRLSEI